MFNFDVVYYRLQNRHRDMILTYSDLGFAYWNDIDSKFLLKGTARNLTWILY